MCEPALNSYPMNIFAKYTNIVAVNQLNKNSSDD